MSVTFGKRIVGEEAHAKAVAAQKGGGEIFGKRVRGALGADNPDNVAKAASEFGPRTTAGAHASDTKGNSGDVSVEDLKKLLDTATGNPTMFDSLYEAELARSGGARKAALEVFREVERGIKGAGRAHVLAEINTLLGLDDERIEREAQGVADKQDVYAAIEERTEENKQLKDLPRLRALRERGDLLKEVKASGSKSTRDQVQPTAQSTAGQQRAIADARDGKGDGAAPSETGIKLEDRKSSDHPTDNKTDDADVSVAAKGKPNAASKSEKAKPRSRK